MRYRTARSFLVVIALGAVALLATPRAAEAQRGRGLSAANELMVFGGVSLLNPENTDPDRPVLRLQAGPSTDLVPAPYHLSTRLDGSAEFGVRFNRYLNRTLAVGGDFSIAPSHELTVRTGFGCPPGRFCILDTDPNPDLVIPEYRHDERVVAYHYGGHVGLDLARGTIRPSVIAGIGAVTYDAETLRETNLAVRVGAALSATANRLVTRVEVLDVITADHFVTGRSEHDVHVRVGLGVRW